MPNMVPAYGVINLGSYTPRIHLHGAVHDVRDDA